MSKNVSHAPYGICDLCGTRGRFEFRGVCEQCRAKLDPCIKMATQMGYKMAMSGMERILNDAIAAEQATGQSQLADILEFVQKEIKQP